MKKLHAILLFTFSLLLFTSLCEGQSWSSVDSGIVANSPSMFGGVFALQTYNGNLYAGGYIDSSGNIPTSGISQWNDIAWDSVNTGIYSSHSGVYVYALTVYNGNLFAGGTFTKAGNISANNIAQWNGSVWDSLGSGITSFNGTVLALAVYKGKLYVGGIFTSVGGISANNIATWGGTMWDSVGGGIPGISEVEAMTVYNGKLYVGGYFNKAGGISVNNIATWDGTKWDSVGGGVTGGNIKALAVYDSTVYAGGNFDSAGGAPARAIASWNGVKWDTVGNVTKTITDAPVIFTLYVYKNNLYAGGLFDTIANIAATSIAYWNGTNWHNLGRGLITNKLPGYVTSLAEYEGLLYAGGLFDTAGMVAALNIARWNDPLGVTPLISATNSISVYPNPSTGIFNIALSHPELVSGSQTIAVYNVLGQSVYNGMLKHVQHDYEINLSSQPAGVYLYRVLAEDGSLLGEGKLIIQK